MTAPANAPLSTKGRRAEIGDWGWVAICVSSYWQGFRFARTFIASEARSALTEIYPKPFAAQAKRDEPRMTRINTDKKSSSVPSVFIREIRGQQLPPSWFGFFAVFGGIHPGLARCAGASHRVKRRSARAKPEAKNLCSYRLD